MDELWRTLTFWLSVDVLWVLLLAELLHAERCAVGIDVVQHVSILVTSQPLVFPVESQWLRTRQ